MVAQVHIFANNMSRQKSMRPEQDMGNSNFAYSDRKIIIREATQSDLQAIYTLIRKLENDTLDYDSFRQLFEENLQDRNCFYLVAETGAGVLGFISLHIQQLLHHCGAVGEIQEFFIHENIRGNGVGRLLMNEVKKYAKAKNVKSLEVTSNKNRIENVEVYERLGFKLTHNKFTC